MFNASLQALFIIFKDKTVIWSRKLLNYQPIITISLSYKKTNYETISYSISFCSGTLAGDVD